MLIEIRKAGFLNKGAELMLHAILEMLRERYPDAKFAMAPNPISQPYEKRIELKLFQKADLWYKGIQFADLLHVVPKSTRDLFGIVLDKEIDLVIDASGFSYSDQWGVKYCMELAQVSKKWKRYGVKSILMPQAFGPFKKTLNRYFIKKAITNVDVVYARDKVSYNHLVDAVGETSKIKIAPDFTCLVDGISPNQKSFEENRICIIPNYRMIDKTSEKDGDLYLDFMIKAINYFVEAQEKTFILIHDEGKDSMLANRIAEAAAQPIEVIEECDPLKIKGIIGASKGVLGSRFHGLVSALSQGVPALATGWSHKYKMLFEDYDFAEGLVELNSSKEAISDKLGYLINVDRYQKIKCKIDENAIKLKQKARLMWEEILKVVEE